MKKMLFGTTALIAAGAMMAPANAAEKIKLGLGGYYQSVFAFVDEDAANTRTDNLKQEGEIYFKGETTLDNGLTVGVQVQLEGYTTADQIDEHYVYFDGNWGRIVAGAENSAAYLMHYAAPSAIAGHGVNSPNFLHATKPAGNEVGTNYTYLVGTGDANKLTYFTPRMSGFQLGLSYTPSTQGGTGGSSNAYGVLTDNNAGAQEQILEASVNYVANFDGVDVAVSGGYFNGSLEAAAPGKEDRKGYSVGANIGYAGFTFGAGYLNDNEGDDGTTMGDLEQYNVGLTYSFGAFTVGAAYGYGEKEITGAKNDELTSYEVGGTYTLGPGVQLMAGVINYDFDGANANDKNEATSFIIGSALSF